jgi:hypothetical protein
MQESGKNSSASGLLVRRLRSSDSFPLSEGGRNEVCRPWSSRSRDTRKESVTSPIIQDDPSTASNHVQMINVRTLPDSASGDEESNDFVVGRINGEVDSNRDTNIRDSSQIQPSQDVLSRTYDVLLEETLEVIASPSLTSKTPAPLFQLGAGRKSEERGKKNDVGQFQRPLLGRIRSGPAEIGKDKEFKKLRSLLTRTLSFRRTDRSLNLAKRVEVDNRSHLSTPPSTECGTIIESIECKVLESMVHSGSSTSTRSGRRLRSRKEAIQNGADIREMPKGAACSNPEVSAVDGSPDPLSVLTFIEVDVDEAEGEGMGFSAITGGSSYYLDNVASRFLALVGTSGSTDCVDGRGAANVDLKDQSDLHAFLEGSTIPNDGGPRDSSDVHKINRRGEISTEMTYEEMLLTLRDSSADTKVREEEPIYKLSQEMTSGEINSFNKAPSVARDIASELNKTPENLGFERTHEETVMQGSPRKHLFNLRGTHNGRSKMKENAVISHAGRREERESDYMVVDFSKELTYEELKRECVFTPPLAKNTDTSTAAEITVSNDTIHPATDSSVVNETHVDLSHSVMLKNARQRNTSIKHVANVSAHRDIDISERRDNAGICACNAQYAHCQDALEMALVVPSSSCFILSASYGYQGASETSRGHKQEKSSSVKEKQGDSEPKEKLSIGLRLESTYAADSNASLPLLSLQDRAPLQTQYQSTTEASCEVYIEAMRRTPIVTHKPTFKQSEYKLERRNKERNLSTTLRESNRDEALRLRWTKTVNSPDAATKALTPVAPATYDDPNNVIEKIRDSLAVNGDSALCALAAKMQEAIPTDKARSMHDREESAATLLESLVDQVDSSEDGEHSLNLETRPLILRSFLEDALVQSAHLEILGSEEWIVPDCSSNPCYVASFHHSSAIKCDPEIYSAEEKKDEEYIASEASDAIPASGYCHDRDMQSNRSSRSPYNEEFTWSFLHEMMSTGQTLLYMGQVNALPNLRTAQKKRAVTMFIEPGSIQMDDSCSFSPRLVWMTLELESSLHSVMTSSVALTRISSIEFDCWDDSNEWKNVHSAPCFSIVTDEGEAHLFQAGSQHSRAALVYGVRNVIAWLCFSLVTGDAVTTSILCSDESSECSSESLNSALEISFKRLKTMNQFAHNLLD